MYRFLKCLTVALFVLSVASLILGMDLYQKREVLKGRTVKLERAVISLAATLEEGFPSRVVDPLSYPARDIDLIGAYLIKEPRGSMFWDKYPAELELYAGDVVDIYDRRDQLMNYFRIDPVTLEPMREPHTGMKVTYGEGTMQELLDEVQAKAEKQQERLFKTRDALIRTRKELVDSIKDLNARRNDLRVSKMEVVKRDGRIAALNNTVKKRDERIEGYEAQVITLNDQIREGDEKIEEYVDLVKARDIRIEYLEGIITPPVQVEERVAALSKGRKGYVEHVNSEWKFVVIRMNHEFIKQYKKAVKQKGSDVEPVLSIIRYSDDTREFVTKVRLSNVQVNSRTCTADIIKEWQQSKIRKGDRVVVM